MVMAGIIVGGLVMIVVIICVAIAVIKTPPKTKESGKDLIDEIEQENWDDVSIIAENGSKITAKKHRVRHTAASTTPSNNNWVWINGVAFPGTPGTPGVPPVPPIPAVPPTPTVAPPVPTFSQPGGPGTPVVVTLAGGGGDGFLQYAVAGSAYGPSCLFVSGTLQLQVPIDVTVGTQLRARAAAVGPLGPGPWSADSPVYTVV